MGLISFSQAENRVLFIGNSFTQGTGGARAAAAGGVPGILDRLAQAGGHEDPQIVMRAVGGMDFEFHATDADTLAAIESEAWTHVIIQNYSTEPTHIAANGHALEDHFAFGAALYDQIVANHAETQVVLYETFARAWDHALISGTTSPTTFESTHAFQAEVRENYHELATRLNEAHPQARPVVVAPVGSAWEEAGGLFDADAEGYVDLHGADNYHGNDNGYYLAAAVFYATLYGESPEGLSAQPSVADLGLQLTVDALLLERSAWRSANERNVSHLEAGEAILIDFGADGTTTGEGWNNVTPAVGSTDDGTIDALITSTGVDSGVGFAMMSRFNGANTNGATGSGVFPDTATQDSLFGNTEEWSGLTDIFPTFKLTGLDPAATYQFRFYAARSGVGDVRETLYTLTGVDTDTVAYDPANNETNVASVSGIVPSASGEIQIGLTPTENNTNGNHFTYLGALEIIASQDPRAITENDLLLDLGGPDNVLAMDGNGFHWNALSQAVGGTDDGQLAGLLTAGGVVSTVGIDMVARFNGVNNNGSTASTVFPAEVTGDSLFGNTEAFSGLENVFPSFKVTGLNASQTYTFTFYASRMGVGDNRETVYTLSGATTVEAVLDPANNDDAVTSATITASATGEVSLAIAPGPNNSNGNHFTYLGAMKISPASGSGDGDTRAPLLESAETSDGATVALTFSEALDQASAEAVANYTVTASDGSAVAVQAVELQADGRTVWLALDPAVAGAFTVSVSNVEDLAGNAIDVNASIGAVAPDPNATVLFLDFGGSQTVFDDPTGRQWNTVDGGIGGTDDGLLIDLIDQDGNITPMQLQMVSRFNGTNTNGTTESTLFDPAATGDSLFGNTELFSELENIFPKFKLTELDPSLAYTLTFFASRLNVGDNRETSYTVEGASTTVVALDPANNIDAFVSANSISPNDAGEIMISIAPTDNNTNGNHFTYLGVLQVSAVPQTAGVTILEHPESATITELDPVSFSVTALGEPPLTVQWFRDGEAVAEATELSWAVDAVPLAWDGSEITVTVSNANDSATSQIATLQVNPDTVAPEVLSTGSADGLTLVINVSEPLAPEAATDAGNYTVSGAEIASVALGEGGTSVLITLTETLSGMFTVETRNLTDRVGNPLAAMSLSGDAPDPNFPTFLFDFGGSGTQLGVDDPFLHWNAVPGGIGQTDDGLLETILTTQGVESTLQLQMLQRFNGTNTAGTPASALYPASATSDSLFGNTELFSELENVFPSFKITGLDSARAYTFTMYASRLSAADNRETGYTIVGGNEGFGALNPSENVDNVTTVTGIVPDAVGEITISIAPTENNDNGNHFTYLGALKIASLLGDSFHITEVSREGDDQVGLTWESQDGEYFVVQQSATLQPGSWQVISDLLPAAAAPATLTSAVVTIASMEPADYFRIAKMPPPALLEQGFEEGLGAWEFVSHGNVGTEWEAGVPSDPPGAAAGNQVAATGLMAPFADGLLNNGLGIVLRSPVVDLSGERAAVLSFWHYLDVNDGQSGGRVKILRADDLSELPVEEDLLFVESTPEWTPITVRLPQAIIDVGEIILEFEFISAPDDNPDNNGSGWFLDDIVLD